jgi:hypothetical protein
MHKPVVHKTLLKSLRKHCPPVFARFLATTIFVTGEHTRHIPGHCKAPGNQVHKSNFLFRNWSPGALQGHFYQYLESGAECSSTDALRI